MTHTEPQAVTNGALDAHTHRLVRLAALIGAGSEQAMRQALHEALTIPAEWVEEVILQSYLFAGFPRTLNAAREWRRISGRAAVATDPDADATADAMAQRWRARGEVTCATVYGAMYPALRTNIARLHPALDHWMVTDGYGKVLSRPALDLVRRELCIVATCALAEQDRQLHSHLHGALNAGATAAQVSGTLDALHDLLDAAVLQRYRLLWNHVRTAHHGEDSKQS